MRGPTKALSAPLLTCTPGLWRQVRSPNGTWNNYLGGAAAVSATDMWAVGNSQSPTPTMFGNGEQNLAEHWDGNDWSIVPTPQPGADANVLNDVAAVATNDVWAVGFSNTTNSIQSQALHWNGAAWTQAALPATPLNGPSVLNDVTALSTSDVWAVGQQLAYNSLNQYVQHPFVVHWNGSAWAYVPSPSVGDGNNVLYGVGGSASNDVWAVGYSVVTASGKSRQSLIEHWNGSAWSVVASPNYSTDTLLSVAAASTSSAWAVGYATWSNGNPVAVATFWNGTTWANDTVVNGPSLFTNLFTDVVAVSLTSYWAVGFYQTGAASPGYYLGFSSHWTGSSWDFTPGDHEPNTDHRFFSAAVPQENDVWGVGSFANTQGLAQTLTQVFNGQSGPNNVTATPGDQSASVSWTVPICNGSPPVTAYIVTAYDGCTTQGQMTVSGNPPPTTVNFTGLSNGTAYTFRVAAVDGFGTGANYSQSSPVTPMGPTAPGWVTACSPQQYTLKNNDGATWTPIDVTNLSVSFTPAADSWAIVSGNADLWTDTGGYNQDLGVAVAGGSSPGPMYPTVSGQPEAWKESGGFAGTFSPNAAYVQTAIPVKAGTTYSATLKWKANKPDPGTIVAGAGPATVPTFYGPPSPQTAGFSPTRLTVRLIPQASAIVWTKSSALQYWQTGSDGNSWRDMDASNLALTFTPPSGTWHALISGNSDLWTSSAGYNQDIGVSLSGPGYPRTAGQPEAWKESGGFAGTFSPNAAFVQASSVVSGGVAYTAKLQWKANKSDPGTIWAGAGPINGQYSPTTLTVILVSADEGTVSTAQQVQQNSDGSYWQPLNGVFGAMAFAYPTGEYLVTVNADLWTVSAGYNQDVGIMVSGGAYGQGTLVAWKESGGFAGTYSPNAAFVATQVHLESGINYRIWAVWKANRIAQSSNAIAVGAGPINASYSPTAITIVQIG